MNVEIKEIEEKAPEYPHLARGLLSGRILLVLSDEKAMMIDNVYHHHKLGTIIKGNYKDKYYKRLDPSEKVTLSNE